MANIQIATPQVSQEIKTSLSQDYTSGTTLTVGSSVSFTNGNYIVVGEPGLENTEVTNITASISSNTQLTITALKFSHPAGTPIYYTNWDKYSLEYRISSTSNWNIYAGMPLSLTFDAQYDEYRDSTATSSYQWRYRYFSTEKTAYSDYSGVIGTAGWSRNSVGYMIREVRKIVNDLYGKTVTDTEIIRFFNSAQDKIYTLFDRWWFLFKVGTAIPTVQASKSYALPSDFGRMHSVQYRFVSGATDITYSLEYRSMTEFDLIIQDNNAGNDDGLKFYSIFPGDSSNSTGYLKVAGSLGGGPNTAGLSIIPRYYKTFTDLVDYADTTEVPIPDLLENYAIGMILSTRKEDDKANVYLGSLQKPGQFYQGIEFLKQLQRKSARPMRYLWQYRGRNIDTRYFGNKQTFSESDRVNNW